MDTYIIFENTFENKLIIEYNSYFNNTNIENLMPIFSLNDITKDYIKNLSLTKRVVIILYSHFPEKEILSIIPDVIENEVEIILCDVDVIDKNILPINCIISNWYHYFSALLQTNELDNNLLKTLTSKADDASIRYVKRYCASLVRYNGDIFRDHVEALNNNIAYNRGKNDVNDITFSDAKAVYKCIDGEHYAILIEKEIENAYKILHDNNHMGVLLCDVSLSERKVLVKFILRNGSESILNTLQANNIAIMKYTSDTIIFTMEWSSLVSIMKTSKELQWTVIKSKNRHF